MREIARAYYNEFDRDAAHVLRCLIADGLIAPGDVDDRSIKDVQPDDLAGYTQIHLFAGAGLWSVAARLAGWPDDRPLWSASCPCQPFSAAGKGLGFNDERDLWPDLYRLIRACKPAVVVGEQVVLPARTISWQDLQIMRGAQALHGVLRGLEGPNADELRRMLEGAREATQALYDGAEVGFPQSLASEQPGVGSALVSEIPRGAERAVVRSGSISGGDPSEDRHGHLRNDRHSVRPEGREDVELSVARSYGPEGGLSDHQRADRDLRAQRDDEHLGRGHASERERGAEGETGRGRELPAWTLGVAPSREAGRHWLDRTASQMEQGGYAFRACNIPACAVDAPHIRQRLYWCALGEPASGGRVEGLAGAASARYGREPAAADQRINGAMADARRGGDEPWLRSGEASGPTSSHAGEARERQRGGNDYRLHAGGLALANADAGGRATATGANASGVGLADACREGLALGSVSTDERRTIRHEGASAIANHPGSVWRGADWVLCYDGKARRTEPGLRLLVDGMAGRIPAWRLGGNSIVAPLAAEVIAALMDVIGDRAGPKRPAPMTLFLEAAE